MSVTDLKAQIQIPVNEFRKITGNLKLDIR
jgi:hypothetical protein